MALIKWKNRDLYDPWADFKSLQNAINELFDVDHSSGAAGLFDRSVSPSIDVIEGVHDFTVSCELPGIEQKDVEVTIASNVITIKGEKKSKKEEKRGKYYKQESWSGSFQRTLPLPSSVDAENISALLKDGILTITLPKKEEARPKQISVTVN